MKKILITGSNGLLGQSLLDLFLEEKNYEIFAVSRSVNRYPIKEGYQFISIDLTDDVALRKVLTDTKPDVIINTAAMTQVDVCEEHKEECHAINVKLVENLISFSEEKNIHLIHLSTDFIFDGKKGFYKETDKPNPLSYYGMSKWNAEQLLLKSKTKFTILRTILVYGMVHDMSRSNIVLWVKSMLSDGKEINVVNDQFRMPTYVKQLALACKLAIDKEATGVFNVSSNELLSVFEIAKQIAKEFNLNESLIKPISSKELNQKAERPSKTGFDLTKTTSTLGLTVQAFKKDLQIFKEKLT
ncbi:SDR family oxidoreductase [Tenacibaculum sp. M341]|uniref:SDR family oxidoreductase n=1 Tax=Tenacibaculum sp. M341 TaxID=2530339 RepID=UPI001045A5B1|nr:SDR family oxidoreductase [Tenacibaculum sp. M341]TCI91838.1 SDR family oxidoreductase [Tenacibaculum sp. M341]